MYAAIERNKNYNEKEVKLNTDDENDCNSENIKGEHIAFDKVPKFSWEVFNSEIYCLEYRVLKHPMLFVSNNQNNLIKIYNLFALELGRGNLELPLPNYWNIKLSSFDILREKYINAKKMQMKLNQTYKANMLPVLERSKSLIEIPQTKVQTYAQLLKKIEDSIESNREPLRLSLRRIEAKRRSLLFDENNYEGQFLVSLEKRIKQRNEDIDNYEEYEKRMIEAQKPTKIENIGTALVSNKDKDIIRTVGYEEMVDEIMRTQYSPQEDMK